MQRAPRRRQQYQQQNESQSPLFSLLLPCFLFRGRLCAFCAGICISPFFCVSFCASACLCRPCFAPLGVPSIRVPLPRGPYGWDGGALRRPAGCAVNRFCAVSVLKILFSGGGGADLHHGAGSGIFHRPGWCVRPVVLCKNLEFQGAALAHSAQLAAQPAANGKLVIRSARTHRSGHIRRRQIYVQHAQKPTAGVTCASPTSVEVQLHAAVGIIGKLACSGSTPPVPGSESSRLKVPLTSW